MEGSSTFPRPDTRRWPRQFPLQALAIVMDHFQREVGGDMARADLLARLHGLPSFAPIPEQLLALGLAKRVLLFRQESGQEGLLHLNRRHQLARKALLARERILSTLDILARDANPVLFSHLERAVSSCRVLASAQRWRQAWLELLIILGALTAQAISQPESTRTATAVALHPASPLVAVPRQQRLRNQIRLLVICDDYLKRKAYSWITATHVIRLLSGIITLREAQAVLRQALADGMLTATTRTSEQTGRSFTAISLSQGNERVREPLRLRNQLLRLAEWALRERPLGVSEVVLVEEFWSEAQLSEEEGWFWLQLLEDDGVLLVSPLQLSPRERIRVVNLRYNDGLISQITTRETL